MQTPCPHCGADVPVTSWPRLLRCPSCGKLSLHPADLPPAAEQVSRDRSRVNGALAGLGALGVIGAFTLASTWPALFLVALLGVFGFSIWQSDRPEARHPLIRLLVGVFALGGGVVVLGLAVIVYLFIQVARGEIRWGGG